MAAVLTDARAHGAVAVGSHTAPSRSLVLGCYFRPPGAVLGLQAPTRLPLRNEFTGEWF